MLSETQSSQSQKLPLMEAFSTIQGEGYHQGKAAYFIRLGGCDVGCHWCDVKESWEVENHAPVSIREIVDQAVHQAARIAVVTGGEPLMHDLRQLTGQLKKKGFNRHLETSGAYELTGTWDWVCLSPKKFKKPLPGIYDQADELKMIIFNKNDFAWAMDQAGRVKPECKLYLQPEWGRADRVIPQVVKFVQQNPRWRVSLQIHKYLGIP